MTWGWRFAAPSLSDKTRSASAERRSWPAGHAKFTGEVGVCLATSGPGAICCSPSCSRSLRPFRDPRAGRESERCSSELSLPPPSAATLLIAPSPKLRRNSSRDPDDC